MNITAKEEDANLQHNNVGSNAGEKVSTKYGYIIFYFWEDSKIQNLHERLEAILLQRKEVSRHHAYIISNSLNRLKNCRILQHRLLFSFLFFSFNSGEQTRSLLAWRQGKFGPFICVPWWHDINCSWYKKIIMNTVNNCIFLLFTFFL